MKLLRTWLWRRRYRKWRRSVGMNLNPKRLMHSMSGVTDFMWGIEKLSRAEMDQRLRLQQTLMAQTQNYNPYQQHQRCGGIEALLGGGIYGLFGSRRSY